jgi:NAD(P)-dependent dehydrogenase (short-subunit alcohol dehydrogenase family)
MKMIKKDSTWLITGCSKGFGRSLAEQALAAGYKVIATARHSSEVADLAHKYTERVLAVELDVNNREQINEVVSLGSRHFGAVDILVNNAGYGYLAAIEEGEDEDVRALFETNVFAPVNLIKAVLPGMRAQGSGFIINLSSAGGFVTYPAIGYYHMAKFAIEGLSETLTKEVGPLGIGVMAVEPGPFRTGFRNSSSMKQSAIRLDAYKDTAGSAREKAIAGDGKQSGDPERGAAAIISAIESDRPPLHLVLGGEALDQFRHKVTELQREWAAWEEVTRSTDYGK